MPIDDELPPGSIYLLIPAGSPISDYTLATTNVRVATFHIEEAGAPYEVWLAKKVELPK